MRNYKILSSSSFQNGNFSLVPIRDEDRFLIMKWRNEQIYHLRQAKPLTKEDQQNYFEKTVAALFEEKEPKQILFSLLENGECIGYGGLVHINWTDKHAEVSFIMNTELEAARFAEIWSIYLNLLSEIAFKQLVLHKLFTYAFDLRPYLYPVLLSSGFVEEARLKEHCLIDGIYRDVLIHSLFNPKPNGFSLRPATEEDTDLFFEWANDPEVRQNSINTDPIPYQTHVNWFNKQLNSEESHLFILSNGKEPLGQIRIQFADGLWAIGYSISKNHRGKKLGAEIVRLLLEKFKQYSFKAIVKKENIASIKVFENLDFEAVDTGQSDILTFIKKSNQ